MSIKLTFPTATCPNYAIWLYFFFLFNCTILLIFLISFLISFLKNHKIQTNHRKTIVLSSPSPPLKHNLSLNKMVTTTTVPDNLTRDQYVYLAKLAEQAERYEEMVQFMQKLVLGNTPGGELNVEERNLLSVAYKNVIGSLRAAWRIVSSIEQKEEGRKNEDHVVLVKEYRSKVESELSDVCASILRLLDSNLIPSATASESKVFYLKMKGDYHRYMAEFKVGDERKAAAEDTMLSYKAAQVSVLIIFDFFPCSVLFGLVFCGFMPNLRFLFKCLDK